MTRVSIGDDESRNQCVEAFLKRLETSAWPFMADVLREHIAELEAAVPRWIPVSERMPEVFLGQHWADNDKVLVATRWGETLVATYAKVRDDVDLDAYWYRMDGVNLDHGDVTHWMPLPPSLGMAKSITPEADDG